MKAIIMAGGFAKRLWPLTKEHAKPLIKVGDKPVINYIVAELLKLKASGELSDIVVSVNSRFDEDFKKWIDNYKFDVKLIVEPCRSEEEKLGAIGAINFVIGAENINDDVMVVNGDNLFDFKHFKFSEVIKFFNNVDGHVVCAYDVVTRERAKLYGNIVHDKNNLVIDFVEKPEHPQSTLISMGCYLFKGGSLKMIDDYLKSGNKKDAPGFFLQWLYKKEKIYAYPFRGTWFDIGDHESLIRADEFARKELS